MLCDKYDGLMMKYMDGFLDSAEESDLKLHMESCERCLEDFEAYSGILKGFNEMEIAEAPPDFAASVMERVAALNLYKPSRVVDVFVSAIGVLVVSVLFGGAALAFFGAEILTWFYDAGLYGVVNVLAVMADWAYVVRTGFEQFAGGLSGLSHQSMIIYSLSLLLVFVVLVVLQWNMTKGGKMQPEKSEIL